MLAPLLDPLGAGVATLANLVRGTGAITPGIGVRYLSSVGPIRVDLGFNPSRSENLAVVTEGARIDLLWGENAPLCESIGADWSRPLKSRTAPATAAGDASDHV